MTLFTKILNNPFRILLTLLSQRVQVGFFLTLSLLLLSEFCPTLEGKLPVLTRMGRQNPYFGRRFPKFSGTDLWGKPIHFESLPKVPITLFFINRSREHFAEKMLFFLPRDLLFENNSLFMFVLEGSKFRELAPRGNLVSRMRGRVERIMGRYHSSLDPKEKKAFEKVHQTWLVDWEGKLKDFYGVRRDPFPVFILGSDRKIWGYFTSFNEEIYVDMLRIIKRKPQ